MLTLRINIKLTEAFKIANSYVFVLTTILGGPISDNCTLYGLHYDE